MSTGEARTRCLGLGDRSARRSKPPRQGAEAKAKRKLELDVKIADVGPCKKHLKVTIPRTEIERSSRNRWATSAQRPRFPGFRPGRAPRQLVVKRFRKQVAEQVKSTLLDGVARADRRRLQARPDHPAQARRRGDRACPTRGR